VRWMHRVRLYPKATQEERLRFMLDVTRQTFNALLDERRYAWKARGVNVTAKMQYAEITALRAADARFASVWTRCCTGWILHLRRSFGVSSAGRRLAIPDLSPLRAGSSWSFHTATVPSNWTLRKSACGSPASVRSHYGKVARFPLSAGHSWSSG